MSQSDKLTYTAGGGSNFGAAAMSRIIHTGKVVRTLPGGRLQVRLKGIDSRLGDERLAICHPMQPLFSCPIVKKGELVRVILGDASSPYEERFWFGPVITQVQYLGGQPYVLNKEVVHNADGIFAINEKPSPQSYPNSEGLYPDETKPDSLYWLGRGNTDARQFPEGIELRSGKYQEDNHMARNVTNPGTLGVYTVTEGNDKHSVNVGLAEEFFFMSHKATLPQTRLGEVTPALLAAAREQGYSLVKGEKLVELLTLAIQAIVGHAHGFDGKPAQRGALIQKLQNFPLTDLLNKNFITV